MSASLATIHTLVPNQGVPFGFFSHENIWFNQSKIKDELSKHFHQDILFDRASIIRIMERVVTDRTEPVPKLNQRVIMTAVNEYIHHQAEVTTRLNFEENYVLSQKLSNPLGETNKYDSQSIKLANRLGKPKIGGTSRFYFT